VRGHYLLTVNTYFSVSTILKVPTKFSFGIGTYGNYQEIPTDTDRKILTPYNSTIFTYWLPAVIHFFVLLCFFSWVSPPEFCFWRVQIVYKASLLCFCEKSGSVGRPTNPDFSPRPDFDPDLDFDHGL
jgi:hypothetical protein